MRSFHRLPPILLVLALAACTPEPAPAPPAAEDADKAAQTAEALPADPLLAGTDASAVVRHEAADPEGFDRKAFAGRFAGILPCAGCPGIETSLEIQADGTYTLSETRDGGEAVRSTGTWTVQDDGAGLLLDPDSKEAADRRFELVSRDEIRAVDTSGDAAAGANTSLRRI
ncbi:copper resistance protein NlpE N-terminal domain-containing protein [Luteimonas sp. SDU82]|uniref:copper resistance protein NlpE N-terminal domain-containing protein n=1 Tax=Luteimonas sp. SDU82 TaxID=3422592 RepID=UPI003EBC98E1